METDIHGLNNDIEWLWALLELLRCTRDNLPHFIKEPYLLSDVFLQRYALVQIYKHYGRLYFEIPFKPALVCRFWRNVAGSTASLWTSLYFPLMPEREELKLNMVQDWLSRSKELPIRFMLGSHYGNTIISHPCIKLLAANVHHW